MKLTKKLDFGASRELPVENVQDNRAKNRIQPDSKIVNIWPDPNPDRNLIPSLSLVSFAYFRTHQKYLDSAKYFQWSTTLHDYRFIRLNFVHLFVSCMNSNLCCLTYNFIDIIQIYVEFEAKNPWFYMLSYVEIR